MKKYKDEMIKNQLDQAIEEGDVNLADQLTAKLLELEGLAAKTDVPKWRYGKGCGRAGGKRRRLLISLAAVMAAILTIGTVAYASGILFPEIKNEDGSATPVNAAMDSKEYRAAREYNRYLDSLTEEELAKTADRSADAVYDMPQKVKEICQEYGLKYATEGQAISSYEDMENQLAIRGLSGILNRQLADALKSTISQSSGGYSFDDGNLHLEMEIADQNQAQGNTILSIDLTPEGSFPWMGFESNTGPKEQQKKTVQIETNSGITFIGTVDEMRVSAFGKAGRYFVTVHAARDFAQEDLDQYNRQLDGINRMYDKKIKEETKLSGREALEEKVSAAIDTADKEEPQLMKEAFAENGNAAAYEKLLKQYGNLSDEEVRIWDAYMAELNHLSLEEPEVAIQDLKACLEKINFDRFTE